VFAWLKQSRKAKLAVTVVLFLAIVGGYLLAQVNEEMTPEEFEATISQIVTIAKQIAAVIAVLIAAIAGEDMAKFIRGMKVGPSK